MRRVAVLDDDPEFLQFLSTLLSHQGLRVSSYGSAGRFLDGIVRDPPALIVLDAHLPGMSGLELLRVIKRNPETKRIGVIVVSGETPTADRVVEGLNDGADEYFPKPLDPELFVARVQSLLRRSVEPSAEPEHEVLAVGALRMDLTERTVALTGEDAPVLTKLEFDLLEYFVRHPNRVITRGILLQEVWRRPPDTLSRTIDKHVQNLRRKLGSFGESIDTLIKIGYIFKAKV